VECERNRRNMRGLNEEECERNRREMRGTAGM